MTRVFIQYTHKGDSYLRKLAFAVAAVALLVVGAPTIKAQTTYNPDKMPFRCMAATAAEVPLTFGMFNCRGIFYDSGNVELFFTGSSAEVFTTSGWAAYNASVALTNFTQPTPYACPVVMPGYHTGCPAGSQPGTFAFNWSGTGTDGLQHSGSVSGTWFNIQYCGGTRCWYYPALESASLTIN